MRRIVKTQIDSAEVKHMLNRLTAPARRHCCDYCQDIFECHLCTINEDSVLHTHKWGGKSRPVICEPCIVAHDLLTIMTIVESTHPPQWRLYDHTTGAVLEEYTDIRGVFSEGRLTEIDAYGGALWMRPAKYRRYYGNRGARR